MAKRTTSKLSGFRQTANRATGYLAALFAGLGLVQVFLAGAGTFGHDFEAHTMLGRVLSTLALLVLILAIVARHSRAVMVSAALLALLIVTAAGLSSLGWDSKWLGGLHALIGITSVIVADLLRKRILKK